MKRKNLIYVFADQWRYQAMGCAGEDRVDTPAMDAFARESVFCDTALSTYPLCSPHRAALLTGKNPLSLGMWTNCKIGLNEAIMLLPQERAISDVLKAEGYETGYVGKWHLDASELNFSAHPASGAEEWDAFTPPGERRHHFDYWYSYGAMNRHMKPHYWMDDEHRIEVDEWSPEHETKVFIDWLEKARTTGRPILGFLSWNPPHPPYGDIDEERRALWKEEGDFRPNVPEGWRSDPDYLAKRRDYFAAVAGLDQQFAILIDYLKRTGLYDESIIVLSADHGDMMGSHGLYGKNFWYEESVRIPLVIHAPGLGTRVCHAPIMSEDQMPTLLELLGVEVPDTVNGVSQKAALEGGPSKRDHSYHMMIPGMPEMVEPYRERGLDNRCFGWRCVRTAKEKYVVDNGTSPGEEQRRMLYDLEADPYEMRPEILEASDPRSKRYDAIIRAEKVVHNDIFLLGGEV